MRRLLLSAWFPLFLLAGGVWGAHAGVKIPSDVHVKIPKLLKGLKAQWEVPPTHSRAVLNYSFTVDKKDNPWLGLDGQYVYCPTKKITFGTSGPFKDLCFLDSGGLILGTAHEVGYASKRTKVYKRTKDVFPFMELKTLLRFNLNGVRLFAATGKGFYVAGVNPKAKKCEIYYIVPDPHSPSYALALKTDFLPDAVAGDGDITFLARGNSILMVKDKKLTALPAGLSEKIRDLAFSGKYGLFYATDSGVGFIYQRKYGASFLQAKNCSIRVNKDNLFVLVPECSGVLKVGPLEVFKNK